MPDKDKLMQGFQMGPWFVLPERGLLRLDDEETHLEPLVMDVLVALAECQGDVLSNDQLIDAAWGGRAVTDDVIVRCIAVLRRNPLFRGRGCCFRIVSCETSGRTL